MEKEIEDIVFGLKYIIKMEEAHRQLPLTPTEAAIVLEAMEVFYGLGETTYGNSE